MVLLAQQGARGLTHRAVDREAGVPGGTTSNYFASRDELTGGLVARLAERLTPDPEVHAGLASRPPSRALFGEYMKDIASRLTADPDVALALFDLRLEAARNGGVERSVGAWLREGFSGDVAFNAGAGLPGGPVEITLFHYALDGLILDRLTTSIDPSTSIEEVIDLLVDRLLPR